MKIKTHSLIQNIEKQLLPRYQDEVLVHQYAWWMLETITNRQKVVLLTQDEIDLTPQQEEKLNEWIRAQVVDHEPLAYLIGSTPFADCQIIVKPPLLIPRPETEEWVLNLINDLNTLKEPLTILDLATGSGCIAIALAKALPHAMVYATDISDAALELAQKNAKHNNVQNVTFIKSDVYKDLPPDLRFDLIVSNPPYVTQDEWEALDPGVTKWEDKQALVAADDGLAIIKEIITNAHLWIKNNLTLKEAGLPQLMIEIGYKQGQAVKQLMKDAGLVAVEVRQDLAGKDRVVCGRVNNAHTGAP